MINYSIIIPHHNCPDLLERLIASIPARDDIQIIVVDDASDTEIVDFSTFKLDAAKRIDFYQISKEKSRWAGHARNIGLEHAEGKWLLFADSDDFYTEDAFEVLDKYLSSDYDVIYYNCKSVYSESLETANRTLQINLAISDYIGNPNTTNLDFLKFRCHVPWNKMISHDFIKNHNIKFEEVIKGNDTLFAYMTAYFADKVSVESQYVYVCTLRKDNMTYGKQTIESCLLVIRTMFKHNYFFSYIGHKEWEKFSLRKFVRIPFKLSFKKTVIAYWRLACEFKKIRKERTTYVDELIRIKNIRGGNYSLIKTKKDLIKVLAADSARWNGKVPNIKDFILHNERWYIHRFKKELRYVEYYGNVKVGGPMMFFYKPLFLWHWYKYKHLSWKLHCTIYPNTLGPGFHIHHVGDFIHIGSENKIGSNCTLLPGVLFASLSKKGGKRTIGNNCHFGVGCKIISAVNIGDNVEVGANAVVTHDIPDNAIVAGVPARIIRIKKIEQVN